MSLFLQVQLILWLIVIIQGVLLIFVITNIKKKRGDNVGIPEGKVIPDLSYSTIRGEKGNIHWLINKEEYSFICTLKPGCPVCEEIIDQLSYMTDSDLKRIKILVCGKMTEIKSWIEQSNINIPVYILDEEDMFKKMNIQMFPFAMVLDKHGEVIKKDIINKFNISTLLELIKINLSNKEVG